MMAQFTDTYVSQDSIPHMHHTGYNHCLLDTVRSLLAQQLCYVQFFLTTRIWLEINKDFKCQIYPKGNLEMYMQGRI